MALQGNFISIAQEKDLLFRSSEWNITLQGGSDLDTKSKLLNFYGNQIDIQAPRGDILFKAKNQISMEAQNIHLEVEHGGIQFESVAGSLSISGGDQIDLHGKHSFQVESQHEDLYITSLFSNISLVAKGDLSLFSESIINFDSFQDVSFESESIKIQADSITLTTLGWNAFSRTGGNLSEAHLESISNELRLIGFQGVNVDSTEQLEILGRTAGVSFSATGEEGDIGIKSILGSIEFTTRSSSETSQIMLESTLIEVSQSEDLWIESGEDTLLQSGKTLEIITHTGEVSSMIGLDGNFKSASKISYSSESTFQILTNGGGGIRLGGSSYNGGPDIIHSESPIIEREILISTIGGTITHEAQKSLTMRFDDDLLIHSHTDLSFRGEDVVILNPYGTSFLEGLEFVLDSSSGDLNLQGGSVQLFGDSSEYTLTDWSMRANQEPSSFIQFHSLKQANWNLETWNLISDHAILGGDLMTDESNSRTNQDNILVEILKFQEVEISSGDFAEIQIESIGTLSMIVEEGDLTYQSGVDSKIVRSERVSFHSMGSIEGIHLETGTTFISESNRVHFNSSSSSSSNQIILSAGTNVEIRSNVLGNSQDVPVSESMDWFLHTKTSNLTLFETKKIFYHVGEQAEFTGSQFLTVSKDFQIHSGFKSPMSVTSGKSIQILIQDHLSLIGERLVFESGHNLLGKVAQGDLEFHTGLHGITSSSIEGMISIHALSNLKVDLPQILIHSTGNSSWFAGPGKLLSTSEGESRLSSDEGHLGFYTEGNSNDNDTNLEEGKMSFIFGGNLTLAGGSKPGDILSMKTNTLRFLSDRINVDVRSGPLRFDLDGPIDVNAQGGVVFQIGNQFLMESPNLITEIGQSGLTLRGGNVNFTSTLAELRFIAGKLIALNSTDVSVASKELDQARDGLFFTSNEHMTLNSQSNIVLFGRESVSIQTGGDGGGGNGSNGSESILLEGPSIEIHSGTTNPEFENQSFLIHSGGMGGTDASSGIFFKSGNHGDFHFKQGLFLNVDQSAKFSQSELFISTEDFIHMISESSSSSGGGGGESDNEGSSGGIGHFLMDYSGIDVEFSAGSLQVGESLLIHAKELNRFQSSGGEISFHSEGILRSPSGVNQPLVGTSDGVGILLQSVDPTTLGEILLHTLTGEVHLQSRGNTLFSGREISIQTTRGDQHLHADSEMSISSSEDLVTFKGLGNIQLEVKDQLAIKAGLKAEWVSQGKVSVQSGSNWFVSSEDSSDVDGISIQTLQVGEEGTGAGGVISIRTKGEFHLEAGFKLNVETNNGNLTMATNQQYSIRAGGLVSISQISGKSSQLSEGVTFNAKGLSSEISAAHSNLLLISGGNLLLEDLSNGSDNGSGNQSSGLVGPIFRGEGISWRTVQGDILLSAKDVSMEANGEILIGSGSGSGGNLLLMDDRVFLESASEFTFIGGEGIFLDAGKAIWFGNSTGFVEDEGNLSVQKVMIGGIGDLGQLGVDFISEGRFSWITDGLVSVRSGNNNNGVDGVDVDVNVDIDIQGSGSSSIILFESKESISIQSDGGAKILSPEGKVMVQSDGKFILEGKKSLVDHSEGLNSYKATSIDWESSGGVWNVNAFQIRENVQGNYSIRSSLSTGGGDGSDGSGSGGAIFQGGKLDFSFGKGVSWSAKDEIRFSTGDELEFSILGDTDVKVFSDARVSIRTDGGRFPGRIEFLPKNSTMEFQVGDKMEFRGTEGVSFLLSSFVEEGQFTVQSEGTLEVSSSGGKGSKVSILSLKESLIEASNSVNISPGELFSVISRNSSSIDTVGDFSITLKNGMNIFTREQTESSIEIRSDSFFIESNSTIGPILFEASEGQFRSEGANEILVEASEIHFVSEGWNSRIELQVEDLFSISTGSVFASSGTQSAKADSLLTSGESKWSSIQNGVFSMLTSPSASQDRSPIVFTGEEVHFSSEGEISFLALSGINPGEVSSHNQGVVSLTSKSIEFQFKKEAHFLTETGGIQMNSQGDLLFSSEDSVLINTHLEKSGIHLQGTLVDFSKVSQELEVTSGRKAIFSTEAGILGLEIDNLLSITAGDVSWGASVLLKTSHEGSSMEIRSKTLEWNSNFILLKADGDLRIMSSNSTLFKTANENPSSRIDIVAQGIDVGNLQSSETAAKQMEHLFHPGLQINSSSVEVSSKVLEMHASGGIVINSVGLEVNVTSFLVESIENVELELKEIKAESISFESYSTGIEVSATVTKSLDIHSEEKFQIKGGKWEANSVIKISSLDSERIGELGNFFTTDQSLVVSADSNIRFNSKEKISGVSETFLNFEVVKGDILFRSITVDQPNNQDEEGPFNLLVEAREREGVISFAPMQRMAHRQVGYTVFSCCCSSEFKL